MLFTAIILSKTSNKDIHMMTLECIKSLIDSESENKKVSFEIILIESDHITEFKYPEYVKVIYPKEKFNFHKFLNIGIKKTKGDYIGLFNNDLIFKKKWLTNILKVSEAYPKILSFCPVDYNSKHSSKLNFKKANYLLGYKTRIHLVGWCIIVKKELFHKIQLDEKFDFYYADDDYGMTLRKLNIKHAVVKNSEVIHLENISTKEFKKDDENTFFYNLKFPKEQIPKYLIDSNSHILHDDKLLEGHIKFHNKWGAPKTLVYKEKISDTLIKFRLGFLNRFLY